MIASFFTAAFATFFLSFILVPIAFFFIRLMGLYVVVHERQCLVYVLFGKVIGIIDEPGIHFLWMKFGPRAFLVRWLGRCHTLDMRLDQVYLRSQQVNSEEGAPMGIGIWYEMYISDPVAYLFENADPKGSLQANVSNTTVRCLSNMELEDMLTNRHEMSREVRAEVSPMSHAWGYRLGSVYIRKVHFRDREMIGQIEKKVVNRLRQVTSAIQQDGENRVDIIASTAERRAAAEFARAGTQRPRIVGEALAKISENPRVEKALFDILELENILGNETVDITLLPGGDSGLLPELLAAKDSGGPQGTL